MNERGFVFLPRRARRGTGGGVPRFFCGRVGGVRCLRAHWRGGEVSARCSIVALRPVGRIARFAPHLQVAVSATGRAPFRCLPVFTQSHAAELARPRYARTLRDSFMRPRAAWAWATLGALPLKPHQGTEFPGPSSWGFAPSVALIYFSCQPFARSTARRHKFL